MSGELLPAALILAASAVVVVISGIFLAKYGDALADLMGWGRLWVGTMLVAGATSLPELVSNITAVSRDQPELAGGGIFGANMINMFTFAMVALIFGRALFFRRVSQQQAYLVLAAIALTGLAALLGAFPIGVSFLEVGLASVLIMAVYVAGMRLVYLKRPGEEAAAGEDDNPEGVTTLRRAWIFFGLASLGVILAATTLAYSTERIADITGLSTGFLGVVVVALVTTMPEATTTIAAMRLGAADLAVGNLYGSCAFNIAVLAVADPFYRRGVLVETLIDAHAIAGLIAVFLMCLGLSQILSRGSSRYLPVTPTLVIMGLAYLGGLFVVYILG